jgi:NADH dehydrogenase
MDPRNILVLGGCGFVGRSVCEHLVDRRGAGDARIVVPTRHAMRGNAIRSLPMVEVVEADIGEDRVLARLLPGIDAVINLVGILHGSAAEFDRVHVELPRRLAAACRGAGVGRIVHVSALGVGPAAPSAYLRSKTAGEEALRSSGLEPTFLRPSVIFGEGDRFLNRLARLGRASPLVLLPAADARMAPVWVANVAEAIVVALDRREARGRVYELGGPRVHTLRELVRLAGRWAGHERPIVALPDAIAWPLAALLEWLPGEPPLTRDNLGTLRVPSVPSGEWPGFEAFGILPSPLEAIAPGYLGPSGGRARLDRWRASARRSV